ncbi:uncharacterized protein LOC131007917 [Salvia miltiorrhiza]|uniref:uncharacterized protein LOC131007917 n=1 Tax=Salvia miltiorrhiza TaxID=226208 RepID=UPI0025AD2D86|nr:uncharacterized protein LOC131007917 [Salvia miltiorrhiza]
MGEWLGEVWEWKLEWNRELRERERAQADELLSSIKEINLQAGMKDCWRWKHTPNGLFSVNSAYKAFRQARSENGTNCEQMDFKKLWKAPAPHKMKTTAWRILKGRMATCDNLIRRNILAANSNSDCILCKSQLEDLNHLFFSCQITCDLWKEILSWIGIQTTMQRMAKENFLAFSNLGDKVDFHFMACVWICVVWCIWKARNDCIFSKASWNISKVVTEIKIRTWSWTQVYKQMPQSLDLKSWMIKPKVIE